MTNELRTITLKIQNRQLIKQVFNKFGYGRVVIPLKTKIEVDGLRYTQRPYILADDLIRECEQ